MNINAQNILGAVVIGVLVSIISSMIISRLRNNTPVIADKECKCNENEQ